MNEKPICICILGGGFGGLYTALRLSQFDWQPLRTPQIVLVDRNDRFLFAPLLYELMTGELNAWEIAPPYVELLANTDIRFLQGKVSDIDLPAQTVQLKDGQVLPYDCLVLALGGEPRLDLVPGAAEHAFPFQTIEDAYRLEVALRELEASDAEKIRIAIAGAGYSGVELACKLADRLKDRARLRLIERNDCILKSSSEFNREAASKALSDRGIWIDLETQIERIAANEISLLYKEQVDTIPVDLTIWTAGIQVNETVRSLPLSRNPQNRLAVTSELQTVDRPEVFALGDLADCCDANGQQVPSTAQAAFQQADYVAWNLWASQTGRPLLSFRYQNLGEMLTLGIDNATLTGMGIKLNGPFAHTLRRLAYLYRMPTLDHQLKVGLNWIAQPLLDFLTPKQS